MKEIANLGIDYHLHDLSISVIIGGGKEIYDNIRLKNDDKVILKYMKKLSRHFEIRACYEASCNGYSFQRKMISRGYHCDVIAPSLIPKKRGERRKNDFRDAQDLVRLYANGLLTIVHPPNEYEESVRNLIRCRIAFKKDEKRVKQQINSLLLAQDLHWPHSKWTKGHFDWLWALKMPHEFDQRVFEAYLGHLDFIKTRILYLDKEIEALANSDTYADSAKKLRALKGISTLTAMLLLAEITDFRRFPNPRALMAFLGLIPSENSSGGKIKGGSITKQGNTRCRTQIIESVQHYKRKPRISLQMKEDLSQVDAYRANIAIKCLTRLHKRYWSLTMKGKIHTVAITAVAREFVGFIWAIMQPEPVTT